MNNPSFNVVCATAIAMCVVGLLGMPIMAKAQTSLDDQTSVVVHYNAAASKTVSGRASFERKIHQAADRVCGPPTSRDVHEYQLLQECRAAAVAGAHAKLLLVQEAGRGDLALTGVTHR